MAKKINKKTSKNTFVIDGLIDSDEKISKIIKKAKKKNIKSVSLLINYDQEKIIKNKKKVIKRKNKQKKERRKNLQIKNISYNQEQKINKEQKLIPANISIPKEKENKNDYSFQKNADVLKQNDEIINSNKKIGEIIEKANKENVKSISIIINYQKGNKKKKIKHNNNLKSKKTDEDKKIDKNINNKAKDQKLESIPNNKDIPKIEEGIEIRDLNTEELRIFKIKKSKYVKISNPNKNFPFGKDNK